jgi:hypothetical protein
VATENDEEEPVKERPGYRPLEFLITTGPGEPLLLPGLLPGCQAVSAALLLPGCRCSGVRRACGAACWRRLLDLLT